jgi:Fasciclin domain/Zinc finger, C2H2 type
MRDIINTAIEAGSFKMLISAVQSADLIATLRDTGPFTVFAPDDQAFTKLPPGTIEGLLKDVPKLKAILMYHIVAGKLTVEEISQMKTAKTIQGQELKIDGHKWHLHMNPKINDANITNADIITENGMIHVLDKVLMPNMELTCPKDGMGFMTMEALNAHTKTGHVVEKTMQPMSVTSSQEIPLRGVEPNQTPCPICGKSFKSLSQMERHRDTVHHETKGHE